MRSRLLLAPEAEGAGKTRSIGAQSETIGVHGTEALTRANLVSTVKGYAAHEREIFQQVTELRSQCIANEGNVNAQTGSEQMLVGALQKLLAVVENYPQLKADRNFLQLQEELVNTEDRIQAARRFYNGNVRDYRNRCETFPSAIVAGLFGFETRDFFNVEPVVREVPKVEGFESS